LESDFLEGDFRRVRPWRASAADPDCRDDPSDECGIDDVIAYILFGAVVKHVLPRAFDGVRVSAAAAPAGSGAGFELWRHWIDGRRHRLWSGLGFAVRPTGLPEPGRRPGGGIVRENEFGTTTLGYAARLHPVAGPSGRVSLWGVAEAGALWNRPVGATLAAGPRLEVSVGQGEAMFVEGIVGLDTGFRGAAYGHAGVRLAYRW
jgi:hypothetical protein